jgi:hypothetical protein
MQGLYAIFYLQKCLAMEVSIMWILLCFVYSHSTLMEEVILPMVKKNYGLACVA